MWIKQLAYDDDDTYTIATRAAEDIILLFVCLLLLFPSLLFSLFAPYFSFFLTLSLVHFGFVHLLFFFPLYNCVQYMHCACIAHGKPIFKPKYTKITKRFSWIPSNATCLLLSWWTCKMYICSDCAMFTTQFVVLCVCLFCCACALSVSFQFHIQGKIYFYIITVDINESFQNRCFFSSNFTYSFKNQFIIIFETWKSN